MSPLEVPNVSNGVLALGYTYDSAGRPAQQTSYSDTAMTTVVSQVLDHYNDLGQLIAQYENPTGSVNLLYPPGQTDYLYTDLQGGLNDSRLVAMVYPDGQIVDYDYSQNQLVLTSITSSGDTATATYLGTNPTVGESLYIQGAIGGDSPWDGTFTVASVNTSSHTFTYAMSSSPGTDATGSALTATPIGLDEVIGRADGIEDAGGPGSGSTEGTMLASYLYLGLGTIVQETEGNGDTLSYIDQSGDGDVLPEGTATSGGDRYTGLDRFGRVDDQFWFNSAGGTIARYQYGYDNDSNVLFMDDLTPGGGDSSAVYTYDALDRLETYTEGTFNTSTSSITGTPLATETWGLDSLGNWDVLTVNGTPEDSTINSQNELTAFDSNTSNQAFDNNGNELSGSTGQKYTYNAWNEMASATVSGVETEYTYDALGRRITITNESTSDESVQYYSADGQVIETDALAYEVSQAMASQYFWGLTYVNDLVARDTPTGESGGTVRIYAIHDANFDVTGITNTSGAVDERFGYTPYGTRSVMNSSYGTVSDSYSWEVGFQGGLMDPATGLVHFGARDYDSVTGRWMEQDPDGYINGPNMYQFEISNPLVHLDPIGTDVWIEGPVGNEPHGHQKLCIGNPNGSYQAYSFGVDTERGCFSWSNGLTGYVYDDTSTGGDIVPGSYLITSPATDHSLQQQFDKLVEEGKPYPYRLVGNSCRNFSQSNWNAIADWLKKYGQYQPGNPPSRNSSSGSGIGATTTTTTNSTTQSTDPSGPSSSSSSSSTTTTGTTVAAGGDVSGGGVITSVGGTVGGAVSRSSSTGGPPKAVPPTQKSETLQ